MLDSCDPTKEIGAAWGVKERLRLLLILTVVDNCGKRSNATAQTLTVTGPCIANLYPFTPVAYASASDVVSNSGRFFLRISFVSEEHD